MAIAEIVRSLRYAKGWGPRELAEAAGVSRTSLFQIESGLTLRPRASTVKRLADALGVAVDRLFDPLKDSGLRTQDSRAEPGPDSEVAPAINDPQPCFGPESS